MGTNNSFAARLKSVEWDTRTSSQRAKVLMLHGMCSFKIMLRNFATFRSLLCTYRKCTIGSIIWKQDSILQESPPERLPIFPRRSRVVLSHCAASNSACKFKHRRWRRLRRLDLGIWRLHNGSDARLRSNDSLYARSNPDSRSLYRNCWILRRCSHGSYISIYCRTPSISRAHAKPPDGFKSMFFLHCNSSTGLKA